MGDEKGTEHEVKEWVIKDRKALGIIGLILGDNVIHYISSKTKPKDAWDEVNRIFGARARNSKIALKI